MSQPRPAGTSGHPHGKASSWLVAAAAIGAFAAGGAALILGWWPLFYTMAGVFVGCVPAGAAVGIMDDTVAWTTPLPPHASPLTTAQPPEYQPDPQRPRIQASEGDVPRDPAHVGTRATGGQPNSDTPDCYSTTGTTPNGVFVGRVGGDDVGYAGTTGAEARAARSRPTSRHRGHGGWATGSPGHHA